MDVADGAGNPQVVFSTVSQQDAPDDRPEGARLRVPPAFWPGTERKVDWLLLSSVRSIRIGAAIQEFLSHVDMMILHG